jgi:hypothetical protein
MEKINKYLKTGDTIKEFSCKCRDWTVKKGDSTKTPDPLVDNFFTFHDCPKMFVYQKKYGVKRWYCLKEKKQ